MMNNGVQQRTPTKRTKPKKKSNNNPIKVVYISNPMKVKTSASEFRALVQELTGQNAEPIPDPSRFQEPEPESDDGSGRGGYKMNISENCLMKINGRDDDENDHSLVVTPKVDPNNNYCQGQSASGGSSMDSFEPFDDVFTPQMIENISAMLPESVFYESPQVDHIRC